MMGGPFQLFPTGPDAATRVLKRGVWSQIIGVLVLSMALLTKMPLLMVVIIPVGALLIALGMFAWLWAVVWADAG
jgi:hypothetical protein